MKLLLNEVASRFARTIIKDRTLSFENFQLTVNYRDGGGRLYNSRASYEEVNNCFYQHVATLLNPDLVVDIGANYGFTGLIFHDNFPKAKLILVEPSPYLEKYIVRNMEDNKVKNYRIVKAVCNSCRENSTSFSLNPSSSQDNRVQGKDKWSSLKVPSVTLTSLIAEELSNKSVFIKIDTQGFETQVFEGGFEFLERSSQWLIKTEFAPDWLLSQGNSPSDFLSTLVRKFLVVEAPARTTYFRAHLCQLFTQPLQLTDVENFIEYVKSLNRHKLGWVDLYIAPKGARSWLK